MKNTRPRPDEYDKAFERYVSRVPETEILAVLEVQPADLAALFASVPAERETYRYAPNKWSIRDVVGHMVDAERVMGYRALAISRGEKAALPAFEEAEYAATAGYAHRPISSILDEFACLRRSHVLMLRHLDDDAWGRVGTANALPITPRALAYVLVGHARHHMAVLAEKYGVAA
jgi:hypothetical protein